MCECVCVCVYTKYVYVVLFADCRFPFPLTLWRERERKSILSLLCVNIKFVSESEHKDIPHRVVWDPAYTKYTYIQNRGNKEAGKSGGMDICISACIVYCNLRFPGLWLYIVCRKRIKRRLSFLFLQELTAIIFTLYSYVYF